MECKGNVCQELWRCPLVGDHETKCVASQRWLGRDFLQNAALSSLSCYGGWQIPIGLHVVLDLTTIQGCFKS